MVHVALQGVSPAQRAAEHSGCRDAGHSQAAALGVASKHKRCTGAAGAARLGHERRLTAQLTSWSTAPSAKGHGSSTLMLWSDECKEEQELLKLRVISAQEQTDFSLASPPRCGAGLLAAARRGPEHPLAGPGTPGCSLEVPAPRPLWAGGGAGSGRSHQPHSAPRTRSVGRARARSRLRARGGWTARCERTNWALRPRAARGCGAAQREVSELRQPWLAVPCAGYRGAPRVLTSRRSPHTQRVRHS